MEFVARNSPERCVLDYPERRTAELAEKAEVSLRILGFMLALGAAVTLVTDKEVRGFNFFGGIVIYREARYRDTKCLVALVWVLGVVAGLLFVQVILWYLDARSKFSLAVRSPWCNFLLDQAMTYILLSLSSASAQQAYFAEQGNSYLHWDRVCNLFSHFCSQVGLANIAAFLTTLIMATLSLLSAYSLFHRRPPC
eukprot:c24692_g1_i1 orf=279-866(+)